MMDENKELNSILSLSNDELEKMFSEFSLEEIELLINKLNEVGLND